MRIFYKPKEDTIGFEFDDKDSEARIAVAMRSIPGLVIGKSVMGTPATKVLPLAVAARKKNSRPAVIHSGARTTKGPGHVSPNLSMKEHAKRDAELVKFCTLLHSKRNEESGVFWKEAVKHAGRTVISRSIYALRQHLDRHARALKMDPHEIYAAKDGVYKPGAQMSVFMQRAFNINLASD